MRILELILAPIEGGAHTLVDALARTWRAEGHEVAILALDPAPSEIAAKRSRELFGADISVVRPASRLMDRFPIKQGSRLLGLRRAITRGQYDVIHAHCMQPNIYSRLASVAAGAFPPIVVTMHSPQGRDYRATRSRLAERLLADRTSAVIAVSEETASDYRTMFPGAASKVVIIPNGIARDVPRRSAFAHLPTRFVALSRIHPQKDILTMIRGFDRYLALAKAIPNLAIAGGFDDPDYETQVRLVHDGLAHREQIRFLGSQSDVLNLLGQSDVFVHSAAYEAHSIAILEAAAAALPIVATDLPSIRESIGSAAEYFAPGDPEALADALMRVTERWSDRIQVAQELADQVGLRYSMRSCADAHLDVLTRAVQRR
jgi:L-malate glycosyltransferase